MSIKFMALFGLRAEPPGRRLLYTHAPAGLHIGRAACRNGKAT